MASAAEASGLMRALDSVADAIDAASSSVVHVRVRGGGAGAGVIWDATGGIVTNQHVVGDAEAVQVVLHDGRILSATVARRHPAADLALLQLGSGALQPARIGDSRRLRVGELVLAIGHPWGQRGVVTAGIVSGIGELPRRWFGAAVELIRSDVQLAPGNSGGPLLNAAGEVVGINSMILGGDLSAAIPSDVVRRWLAAEAEPHDLAGAGEAA